MDVDLSKEMRTCRKHGGEPLHLITHFPRNKNGPLGYDKMCKQCWRDRPKKNSKQLLEGAGKKFLTGKDVEKIKKSKMTEPVEPAFIPDDVEQITLTKLSNLPGNRKFFEWTGSPTAGMKRYQELYDQKVAIIYIFRNNRYFLG